jgi:adenine-specific DNA-methyltransferase
MMLRITAGRGSWGSGAGRTLIARETMATVGIHPHETSAARPAVGAVPDKASAPGADAGRPVLFASGTLRQRSASTGMLNGHAGEAADEGAADDVLAAHLSEQVITYLGNKRSLLRFIDSGLKRVRRRLGKDRLSVFDVFSGSGVVARLMKLHSERLLVCDIEEYSGIVNACYLSNHQDVDHQAVRSWIDRMNREGHANEVDGVISELYAPRDDDAIQPGERVFYTRRNARFIDGARRVIDQAPPELRHQLLAPLLYVASVHANTSGVFKGFYKNSTSGIGQFGGNGRDALQRICKPFSVPYPLYSRRECDYSIYRGDANQLLGVLPHVDVAYLDPPYNQHPYGSNYFMLNLIASGRRPSSISAVSGIPRDWNRSAYNKRTLAKRSLQELAAGLDASMLLISFNSDGFIGRDEMVAMLEAIGPTEVLETSYNTFRGSRNLTARDLHVTEYLFLVEKAPGGR